MTNVRKIFAFVLVMAIAMTVLIVPAAAAEYVPTCGWCGNTNITPTGNKNEISLGDEGTYVEYEYKCFRCGGCTWIDASLLW